MADGDSKAEQIDAGLAQERTRKYWQQQATEDFPEIARQRAEIERLQADYLDLAGKSQSLKTQIAVQIIQLATLQRENAELQQNLRLADAVKDSQCKMIAKLTIKLAAAEAALTDKLEMQARSFKAAGDRLAKRDIYLFKRIDEDRYGFVYKSVPWSAAIDAAETEQVKWCDNCDRHYLGEHICQS